MFLLLKPYTTSSFTHQVSHVPNLPSIHHLCHITARFPISKSCNFLLVIHLSSLALHTSNHTTSPSCHIIPFLTQPPHFVTFDQQSDHLLFRLLSISFPCHFSCPMQSPHFVLSAALLSLNLFILPHEHFHLPTMMV